MFDTLSELAAEWILPTVFFWLVLCILATNIQEWIAMISATRQRYLTDAISKMLGDPELIQKFYQSPLIKTNTFTASRAQEPKLFMKYGFLKKKELKPDYLNPRLFAQTILSWIVEEKNDRETKRNSASSMELHESVRKMRTKHAHLAEILEIMLSEFRGKDLTYHEVFLGLQANLENWFLSVMEETTRAYQRFAQHSLLIIGFSVALLVNFDPIFLTTQLWSSSPSSESASGLPVGWNITPLIETQNGDPNCQFVSFPSEKFGVPLRLGNVRNCISPSSATNNTTFVTKFFGFAVGGFLIRIGSKYVHDLWKTKAPA